MDIMWPYGYTVQITNLSPRATEKDVREFFLYCGEIENVEIVRSDGYSCAASVAFRDAYASETALLLNGSIILDRPVCISWWGAMEKEYDLQNSQAIHADKLISSAGEAVTVAQEVVKTMVSKGYVMGKDAMIRAKAFDESYHLSSVAGAKVAELGNKIGLTDAIYSGVETFKSMDRKFHVSDITQSAATVTGTAAIILAKVTGKAAAAAGTAVVHSSFFSKGALWVSAILNRAAKAAADMGSHAKK